YFAVNLLFNNQNSSLSPPSSSPLTTLSQEDISINLKYCGEPKCKFMFVYGVLGEQESRLNLHFSSLAKLAIFLNRTLVLTNVGHSEMNACSDFPFEFYYDIEQLKKNMPGLQVITQKDFYNWIGERSFKPNVTLSYMSHKEPRFTSSKPSTQFFKNPEDEQCYNSLNLKPIDYKEVYCGANIRTKEYREEMKSFLMKEFDTDVEILLIRYILYGGEFLEKGSVLAYAKHIVEASSRVVNKLKPFIAIHWRMESADEELAPKCSLQLNHHLAISYLNSLLSVKTWVSMKALDYLSDDKRLDQKAVQHELKGAGVQGIMDKLILMNADYFVSGPSGCARIRSLNLKQLVQDLSSKCKNVEDFHQIPDKYDDLQIESTTITKASKLNQTITPTTASKPKAVKIRPILNYHGKPTLEQMQAYQDQPIPFKSKMECESYHEQNGISSKELWNWSPIRVFIGIWTTAKGHKIRSIVRAINLKQQENLIGDNVDFKFILGRPPKDVYTPDLKLKLTTENDTYGDLVMLDMEENMNNGKAYYYWKWVWEHLGTMKYDYAAKADDDVFVHFQNLALNLRPLPRDNVYYGCKHKYYITGMLVVLSMNYPHLISTTPFNKTEWRGGEDTRLGKWLINHANSTLNPIDEHCLLFQDPRIPVFYVVGRKWASPQSIVIHWLKDLYAWKGVIDLYIPDVIKDLKASTSVGN
ncbi:18280_t:CDS:2, partial [Entrophospora sp. SA101]